MHAFGHHVAQCCVRLDNPAQHLATWSNTVACKRVVGTRFEDSLMTISKILCFSAMLWQCVTISKTAGQKWPEVTEDRLRGVSCAAAWGPTSRGRGSRAAAHETKPRRGGLHISCGRFLLRGYEFLSLGKGGPLSLLLPPLIYPFTPKFKKYILPTF